MSYAEQEASGPRLCAAMVKAIKALHLALDPARNCYCGPEFPCGPCHKQHLEAEVLLKELEVDYGSWVKP